MKNTYSDVGRWTAKEDDGWTTGPERPAPEGVWRTGGGIELPCCYVLYGLKESRKGVRECVRDSSSKKNVVRN